MKEKERPRHLLYDDVIHFFLARKCQKTRKLDVSILNEKISISSEQLEELQWNFQERRDLVLKVTKKQGFTLSLEYKNLEQVTTTVKMWSEKNLSKISNFSILGKVFLSVHFCRFWILSYNHCQNLKWQNTFRDFRVFDFGYRTKSKTRKPRKFSIFLVEA